MATLATRPWVVVITSRMSDLSRDTIKSPHDFFPIFPRFHFPSTIRFFHISFVSFESLNDSAAQLGVEIVFWGGVG
jgi:hypothetical protein